jgi:hypothetical protein
MRVILRIWSVTQSTSSGLRSVYRHPCQIQCNYNAFSNFRRHISNLTYLRYNWDYVDSSMRVILRIWSSIQSTLFGFHYITCVTSQMQWNYNAFSNFRRHISNLTYVRYYWDYIDSSMRAILRIWSLIQSTSSGLRYINSVPLSNAMQILFSILGAKNLIESTFAAIGVR